MIMQWLLFAVLLALLFRKAKIKRNPCLDGLDRNTTATINGFFICVVLLHHFSLYCRPSMRSQLGLLFNQLMVVTFLFYSGYGCAAQFLKKGWEYIQSFPRSRILSTIGRFDFAVCIFTLLALLLGRPITVRKIALSLIGWDSVGNSNWYIFDIVLCYVAFYTLFSIFRKFYSSRHFVAMVCVGTFTIVLGYVIVLSRVKPPWWYDTMLAFPAGVAVGLCADPVLSFLRKRYWSCLLALVVVMAIVSHYPLIGTRYRVFFNIKSVAFALVIVMASMRIKLDSPALFWCGRHLFALYIYQRIPMVIFTTLHPAAFQSRFRWIYFALSLAISLVIAWLYDKGESVFLKRRKA